MKTEETPVTSTNPPVGTPTRQAPTQQEIGDWNSYLKYFNEKVRTDGVTDEQLDTGDGKYAKDQFDQYNMLQGKQYDYDTHTKKMQDYYNATYNSPNVMYSAGLKKNYPKPELSKVDGRIGSYTRNYYIPSYTRAEADGKANATYNPYADTFQVAQNSTGKSEEDIQNEMKASSKQAR